MATREDLPPKDRIRDRQTSQASERLAIRSCQEPLALIGGEPVPDADSNPAHSLAPSDPGRKFRTEQTGIGGLIRDPPNGSHAQVDR